MAVHHPSLDLLQAYSAGNTHPALALAVAAHCSMCSLCRQRLAQLNEIGGTLLENVAPVELSDNGWQALQARLQQPEVLQRQQEKAESMVEVTHSKLPAPLSKLMPQGLPKKFTRIGWSLRQATLKTMSDGTVIALHHISAGGTTPRHTHEGQEVTLVLEGSFSDENGLYQPGDFLLVDEHTDHRPTASKNEDCLCFTVQLAPLKLTGPIGKWFNPIIRALQ